MNTQGCYDIAVIGEAMSGKSTFIFSFFNDNIAQKLMKDSIGQTRILTHYFLQHKKYYTCQYPRIGLTVAHINWNLEQLNQYGNSQPSIKELNEQLTTLGLLESTNNTKQLRNDFKDYLTTENYRTKLFEKVDAFNFIANIINNEEVYNTQVISYVEIVGEANEEVNKFLTDNKLKCIKLQDTPQVQPNIIKQDEVQNTELNWSFQSIGLTKEADAYIFLSMARSNNLISQKVYTQINRDMLTSANKLIYIIRDNYITRMLFMYKGLFYEAGLKIAKADEVYSGFDSIKVLLERCQTSINDLINEAHITPDIPDKSKIDSRFTKLQCTVNTKILVDIVKVIKSFHPDSPINRTPCRAFFRNYIGSNIINGTDIIKQAIRVLFNQLYDNAIFPQIVIFNDGSVSKEWSANSYIKELYFVSRALENEEYNDIIGSRGGIHHNLGKPILRASYKILDKIFKELPVYLETDIRSFLLTRSLYNIDTTIKAIQQGINRLCRISLYVNSSMTADGLIMQVNFLINALEKSRGDFKDQNGIFAKYMQQYKIPPVQYNDKQTPYTIDEQIYLSRVKTLFYYIITQVSI